MSNPLSRWFRSKAKPAPESESSSTGELDAKLARLEQEAETADTHFKGIPLNRAGDLCMRSGERERALTYYGRAIDAYLADEQPEAARAVAQKLIRLHPQAIRTLCTITWLDLAAGHLADALLHLGEYVEAARRGGQQALCRRQIMEMARIVGDDQFRITAGQGLRDLGFEEDAQTVRSWVGAEDAPEGAQSSQELREQSFAAAVGSNELRMDE